MYRTLWTSLTSKYPHIINLSGDCNNGSLDLVVAEDYKRFHNLFCMRNGSYGVGVDTEALWLVWLGRERLQTFLLCF